MIFFCAVNDISEGSKFYNSMLESVFKKKQPLWGITELSATIFSKIKKNDYVLFYYKGNIIGIGQVHSTVIDKNLAKTLWGVNQHKIKGDLYWSNILVFSHFHSVTFPFRIIIEIGKYSSKFSIRRIIALNKIGIQQILKDFGNEKGFVEFVLNKYTNKILLN